MIQFNKEEVAKIQERSKRQPKAVQRLRQQAAEGFQGEILVPKKGIGNWSLYYYCPDCSVRLQFQRQDAKRHRCPSCGRVLTGEPYDGAWWGLVNAGNSESCFQMGLLYVMTEEMAYARKAIAIMLEYSRYYKDYEVHGDIPYNGPGKANAQTLDEANFLRSLAMAYDLLSSAMSKEERERIRDGILLPGAEFLIAHRHRQLHNHEVIINSAIAVIGLLFEKEAYIQLAVYGEYGILYQLEHAVLPNHMWFEGAFGYHFYALTSFFAYEKFALHTPHSHIQHPHYKAMMDLLFFYLEPGFRIPMLNDTNYGHTNSSLYLYEFAYRELGGEKLLYVLDRLYEEEERDNLEALIYGVDELKPCELPLQNYHTEVGSFGHSVLRGENGRYLLFKHDSYGGEHDHYDRLDISYLAYGKRISPDLGTTGYGAKMHYDYYKNTGTHNTVTIGGENQAPANAYLTRYEEKNGVIYVDAEVDWRKPYEMPDSFTIVQWKEENYRNVHMKRRIAWAKDCFADVFVVEGVEPTRSVDWVMHFSGQALKDGEEVLPAQAKQLLEKNGFFEKLPEESRQVAERELEDMEESGFLSSKKPYCHIHDIYIGKASGTSGQCVFSYKDGEVITDVYSMAKGQWYFSGMGADNPSISEIPYLIERNYGKRDEKLVYAHVIASREGKKQIQSVRFALDAEGEGQIVVTKEGGKEEILSFASTIFLDGPSHGCYRK